MKKSYLKIFCAILLFSFISLNIKDLHAGVYFIDKPDNVAKETPSKPCVLAGYTYTASDCEKDGLKLNSICPENAQYGRSCSCDEKIFQYNSSNCSAPKVLSGSDCNGKYSKCDCDSNVYKYYINADCPVNKVVDTKAACTYADKKTGYSKCACPSQYSETCSGNLEGVGTACDGKYVSCRCKSNFIDCGGQKAAVGASSCVDSTGTKYTSCQPETCENNGYVTTIPTDNICTTVKTGSLTCYKDCKPKTCVDGGYVAAIPTNNSCTAVSYAGLTCYKDCKPKTCADGGYVAAEPAGQSCSTVSYSGLTCYNNCKCDPAKEVCRVNCAGVKTACQSGCKSSCAADGIWLATKTCAYPLFANEECTGELTPIGGSCGYTIPRQEENEGECTSWFCGVKKGSLDACLTYCEGLSSSDSKCSSCHPVDCINRMATPNTPMY